MALTNKERAMTHATTPFHPPLSSQVLGAFARAFHLADVEPALKDKSATRYFAGEAVSDEMAGRYQRAFATAVLKSGLLPQLVDDVATRDRVVALIAENAAIWDGMVGTLIALPNSLVSHPEAGLPFLRFATIDFALRAAGFAWMFQSVAHHPDGDLPAWAPDPEARRSFRRGLQERCRATRHEMKRKLNHDHKAQVDRFFDAEPIDHKRETIAALAKAFAELGCGDEPALRVDLLWHQGLCALMDDLVRAFPEEIGTEAVLSCCRAFVQYRRGARRWLKESPDAKEELLARATRIFLLGVEGRAADPIISALEATESDPLWKQELRGCLMSVLNRMQYSMEVLFGAERALQAAARKTKSARAGVDEQKKFFLSGWSPPPAMEITPDVAARITPGQWATSLSDLAARQSREGSDPGEAVRLAREAVRLDGENWFHQYRLAALLADRAVADGFTGVASRAEVKTRMAEARTIFWLADGLKHAADGIAPTKATCPEDCEPWVEVGSSYYEEGDARAALDHLERWRERFEEPNAWLLYLLGIARVQCGDCAGAVELLKAALRLRENEPRCLEAVADALLRVGEFKRAQSFADQARRLGKPDVANRRDAGHYDKFKRK